MRGGALKSAFASVAQEISPNASDTCQGDCESLEGHGGPKMHRIGISSRPRKQESVVDEGLVGVLAGGA